MAKDHEEDYTVENMSGLGTVKIADEVVVIIAGLAATEVDGVTSLAGGITNSQVSKISSKNLSKGVRITVSPDDVKVNLAINIAYGVSIPEISKAVQERVKNSIETMTGLAVTEIDIRIADVDFDNN